MVGVEHLTCMLEIEVVFGEASSQGSVRIHSRYVRITPYSAAACGSRSSRCSSRSAALRDLVGQLAERREPLPELGELRLLGVGLAELGLDRLELLTKEVLALTLLHLGLHLRLDPRAELEHLELAVEDRRHHAQSRFDVDLLEDLLSLRGRDRA